MKKQSSAKTRTSGAVGETHLVFLSHAMYDKWIAETICHMIEKVHRNARVFRDDRDIAGGDSIPTAIKEAMRSCDEVVVLLTPESIHRPWVLVEIGMALALERRIVPLLYHVTTDQIPQPIKDPRAFHLNELPQYLEELKQRASKR